MKKINITISGGLGRMGSLLIKKTLKDKMLNLSSVTEQQEQKKNGIQYKKNSIHSLKNTNVIIDFTRPHCTSEILKIATKLKKKLLLAQQDLIKNNKTK